MLLPDLNILKEIAGGNPTMVYKYWRERHSDSRQLNQGYLMKEKIYLLVMKGIVDCRWFADFYGVIDDNILRELNEKTVNQ
jgi:toxin co-regulated pilus biosynthesis protein T